MIIKFLFVVSTYFLLTSGQELKRQAITRLNYGVIIRPKQLIRLLTDEWTRFRNLSDPENFKYSESQMKTPDCTRNADNASVASCESVKTTLRIAQDAPSHVH